MNRSGQRTSDDGDQTRDGSERRVSWSVRLVGPRHLVLNQKITGSNPVRTTLSGVEIGFDSRRPMVCLVGVVPHVM